VVRPIGVACEDLDATVRTPDVGVARRSAVLVVLGERAVPRGTVVQDLGVVASVDHAGPPVRGGHLRRRVGVLAELLVDVVDELGIARRTAHNKLNALVERGELKTRKIGARGRVWWVPIPAEAVSEGPTENSDAESG
jgi:hypothetical protein